MSKIESSNKNAPSGAVTGATTEASTPIFRNAFILPKSEIVILIKEAQSKVEELLISKTIDMKTYIYLTKRLFETYKYVSE